MGHKEHNQHDSTEHAQSKWQNDLEKQSGDRETGPASTRNSIIHDVPEMTQGEEYEREDGPKGEHEDESTEDAREEEEGSGQGGLAGIIERAASRVSTKSSWNPGPPPDGGIKAWMAVAGSHLVVMNTWGYINSFGVFQTYYSTTLNLPPSTISWIGSIQVFLLFFIGAFTGRLTDAGYFRHILFVGSLFQLVGIFTTSVCTSYWQLFLAQGICMGIGNGCLFCPSVATVSTYFSTKRGLAIGISACGSATGGLIFPAMAKQLLPTVGFGWTIRAIGFVQIFGFIVASLGLKTRVPPRKAGPLVEWAAFEELEYTLFVAGGFTCFLGLYFAFYYLASFSRDIIDLSYTDSLNLLLALSGTGIPGRLITNYLADRLGAINVFIPVVIIGGICQLSWIGVKDDVGLWVWTIFYGLPAGGLQSLFPAGLGSLTTDLRKAGTRMGMAFTIVSFASLTGPPIAGAIISRCGGQYYGAQAFAGCCMLVGGGFMAAAKFARMKRINGSWRVKV